MVEKTHNEMSGMIEKVHSKMWGMIEKKKIYLHISFIFSIFAAKFTFVYGRTCF